MVGRRWVAAAMALATVLALCGCSLFTTVLDDAANGTIQQLDVGDVLEIRLQGNPSTGYEWARTAPGSLDAKPLKALSEGTHAPDGGAVGTPVTTVFRYRALRTGTVELVFNYRRSWEPDTPAEVYSVTVWVR